MTVVIGDVGRRSKAQNCRFSREFIDRSAAKWMVGRIEVSESKHALDAAPPATDEGRIYRWIPGEVRHYGSPRDLSRGRAYL